MPSMMWTAERAAKSLCRALSNTLGSRTPKISTNSSPPKRAYGELRTEETVKRHKKGQQEIDDTPAEHSQLKEIQQQLTALQQTVTLMLEDKSTREAELRQHDEERTQLLAEISRLNEDLEQEKKRSLWSRLFRRDIEEKNREK
jgi:peptidoglycan hydrolase CwlO-like protein